MLQTIVTGRFTISRRLGLHLQLARSRLSVLSCLEVSRASLFTALCNSTIRLPEAENPTIVVPVFEFTHQYEQ